jgi:beta-glucanase (GH16 family)
LPPPPQFQLPAAKWRLTWADEFTGKGTPAKWTPLTGGDGWSHKALQYYTRANAKKDGRGNLVISATTTKQPGGPRCWYGPCRYNSARLQTAKSFSQAYGRFTARIKLPKGPGLWPAFWLQRVDAGLVGKPTYGEIDVMETVGDEAGVVRGYAHGLKHRGGGIVRLPQSADVGDYHIYGVDWTPQSITWWVDDKPYAQFLKYSGWPFTKPFFLILNLQVGGEWPGPPNATTRFPADMTVDWIRVYRTSS